jgi:hypothetical protein
MQAAGADVSERATKVPNSSIVTFEAMVEIAQGVCWQQWQVGHCDVFESTLGTCAATGRDEEAAV